LDSVFNTTRSLSFRNEVPYLQQSIAFGATMTELCSFQIWCSLVHPSEEESLKFQPLKTIS